jgi:uncharacterized protein (DUF2141 family)
MKRYITYVTLCILICSAAPLKNSADMKIEITGLKNDIGSIKLSMFNSASGFPRDGNKAFKIAKAEIRDKRAFIVFPDVPFGRYAIAFLHDENDDNEMNFSFYGTPKEQYGFSNDAHAIMSAPDFEEAAFNFDKDHTKVVMKAKN